MDSFFPKVLDPLVGLKKLIIPVTEDTEKYCRQPVQQSDDAEKRTWTMDQVNN